MKITKLIAAAALLGALPAASHGQALLAGWDFTGVPANNYDSVTANFGDQSGSAAFWFDGTNGSSTFLDAGTPPASFDTGEKSRTGGTGSVATAGTPFDTSTSLDGNVAVALIGNDGADTLNGKAFTVGFSTAGLTDLSINYAARSGSNGPDANQWAWSVDGSSWTDFSGGESPSVTYSEVGVDLSSLAALDNQTNVWLRYTLGGQTAGSAADNLIAFDNFAVSAAGVIPEPSIYAAAFAMAALGIAVALRRRTETAR